MSDIEPWSLVYSKKILGGHSKTNSCKVRPTRGYDKPDQRGNDKPDQQFCGYDKPDQHFVVMPSQTNMVMPSQTNILWL